MPKTYGDGRTQSPNHFLNQLLAHMHLKNDAALSRKMDVAPPVLSKIRHNRLAVTPGVLIKAHDASGLSINQLREFLYASEQDERVAKGDDYYTPPQVQRATEGGGQ